MDTGCKEMSWEPVPFISKIHFEPEADPDPNQRGGRRGGRDLSGGAAGGAETISG